MQRSKDKLFVALDVDTPERALELVRALLEFTHLFKIGANLFTVAGPDLIREAVALGAKVFLDLKFHDIPNTVAAASAAAARLGIFAFTLHAAGGREMMRRSAEAASEAAEKCGYPKPMVLGVTVLTSNDTGTLREVGVTRSVKDQVTSLARLCAESDLGGVVASPREVRLIRATVTKPNFVVVTPGIRSAGDATGDQKRVMTAVEAVEAGADYIVVGRPIIGSPDPVLAARQILEQIESTMC